MGWFDNEQEADKRPGGSATPAAGSPKPTGSSRPAPSPSPGPAPTSTRTSTPSGNESGSTLGRRIHIDGAIVCDEDLTILGKVDGTIRAKGTLVIAEDADVKAKIDGQRVVVHGTVAGNVQGAELVVIGPTGNLAGNVKTPALEIVEGAYFKGSVDMKTSPAKAQSTAKPEKASSQKPKSEGASSGSESSGEEKTPAMSPSRDKTPVAAQNAGQS